MMGKGKDKEMLYLPIGQAAQRQWEATGELWILLLNGRVAAANATELLSGHSRLATYRDGETTPRCKEPHPGRGGHVELGASRKRYYRETA